MPHVRLWMNLLRLLMTKFSDGAFRMWPTGKAAYAKLGINTIMPYEMYELRISKSAYSVHIFMIQAIVSNMIATA